jgi:hypothetical protein
MVRPYPRSRRKTCAEALQATRFSVEHVYGDWDRRPVRPRSLLGLECDTVG